MNALDTIRAATEMNLLVAFFDLSRFSHIIRNRSEQALFDLLSDYYEFVGDTLEPPGGKIVKFIGDAALIVFPENAIDAGVLALKDLQQAGDAWLKAHGAPSRHIIKVHFGPVCCGPIGTRSEKPFDVFGETVNIAATLASHGLAITPQVFRKLAPETRKHFKKHTPPITYIPVEEKH